MAIKRPVCTSHAAAIAGRRCAMKKVLWTTLPLAALLTETSSLALAQYQQPGYGQPPYGQPTSNQHPYAQPSYAQPHAPYGVPAQQGSDAYPAQPGYSTPAAAPPA